MVWVSEWAKALPAAYVAAYRDYIAASSAEIRGRNMAEQVNRDFVEHQVFGRMQQAHYMLLPFIGHAAGLNGLRVFEIGAGSGSATTPMAMAGARVVAADILTEARPALLKRFELLGLPAPDCVDLALDWIAAPSPETLERLRGADLVLMYALFEHLTVAERIGLLRLLRRETRPDCLFCIFETPNRLHPYDWHTTGALFADALPDDLYIEYLAFARKGRPSDAERADFMREARAGSAETIYRRGRGASFHEFEVAVGLGALRIENDGFFDAVRRPRDRFCGPFPAYEAFLQERFATLDPPPPPGFSRPALDLLFRLVRS